MSGINGIFQFDGEVTDAVLRRMTAKLGHRGGDGTGIWQNDSVGFGHQLLCTTPEAHDEKQPLVGQDQHAILVADARIDNRNELAAQLRSRLMSGDEAITDDTLILAAYEKWGEACLEHLLGDFAFAIWDDRRQRLFCARDHMGIRPLYYYHCSRFFAFSSEIKALLDLPDVPRSINEVRVAEYLAKTSVDPTITFYENIRRVPPAHHMVVNRAGDLHRERYWSLDPERELHLDSDAAYEERFREIFTDAVRCRLRSDTPVGVALSGGLDSSSVACVARELLTGETPLHTFSATFPGLPEDKRERADESEFLDALEQQGSFQMHRMALDEVSPLDEIDRTLWHLDQPPFICNLYLINHLHKAARDSGVKVMLDGSEGDIAVSHGMGYLGELALEGCWERLEREIAMFADRAGGSPEAVFQSFTAPFLSERAEQHPGRFAARDVHKVAALSNRSRWRLLWTYALKPRVPDLMLDVLNALRGRADPEKPFRPLINRDLVRRTRLQERLEQGQKDFEEKVFSERLHHWAALHLDIDSISTIEEETNHLGAMWGVERRHPFYDIRLLSFCLSLPPEQKLKNGWTRSILRRSMQGILPEKVRKRSGKANLSPNFHRNLLRFEAETLDNLFQEDLSRLDTYFDRDRLHEVYERQDTNTLWTAMVFNRWLKQQKRAIPEHTSSLKTADTSLQTTP